MCAHNARSTGARPIAVCRLPDRLFKLELLFSCDKILSSMLPLQVSGKIGPQDRYGWMETALLKPAAIERNNTRWMLQDDSYSDDAIVAEPG